MPGVPYSRGCDGCRLRKKKCDLAKPACSRCNRLHIPCLGAGKQRFMFKITISDQKSEDKSSNQISQSIVALTPSNRVSMMTRSLISLLQIKDTRFDLSIYGNFVDEIPQRLGTNKVLDAAVVAFTTSMPCVYTHNCSASMYSSYAEALRLARASLSDQLEAYTPETLCAIYLLMICQGWMGKREDVVPKHGEALSHLLNKAPVHNWNTKFERDLLSTLVCVTVLESFSNPNIEIDQRLFSVFESTSTNFLVGNRSHIDCLHVKSLAKMSKLLQHPNDDLAETQSMYRRLLSERLKISALLSKASKQPPSDEACYVQVRLQMGYALLLSMALLFNAVLHPFEATFDFDLVEESAILVDEVIHVAKQSAQYRPLGSSSMPLCLVVAWAMSDHDETKRAEIENILANFQLDFDVVSWLDSAQLLKEQLRNPVEGSIVAKPRGVVGFSGSPIGVSNVDPTVEKRMIWINQNHSVLTI